MAVLQRCKGGLQKTCRRSLWNVPSEEARRETLEHTTLVLGRRVGEETEVGAAARELETRGVWRIFGRERPLDAVFPEEGRVWERRDFRRSFRNDLLDGARYRR